jgi:hypothetical protein
VDDGVASDDVAADCVSSRCEGGEHIVEADPSDVDDGIICTMDSCDGGPSHEMLPVGTACDTGNADGTCTANGNCEVECSPTEDCEQFDPCTERNCVNYHCVEMPLLEPPRGTEDAPGDCRVPACDRGVLVLADDDLDLPADDGNPCTGETCVDGAPVHPALLDTSCGGAMVCDGAGACVECTAATLCPASTAECAYDACVDGACTQTAVAEGEPCLQTMTKVCDAAGACVPSCMTAAQCGVPSDDCVGWVCMLSYCQPAPVADGDPCAIGVGVCNAGDCAECFVAGDCTAAQPLCTDGWTCNGGVCDPTPAAEGTPCGAPTFVCCNDQTCQLPATCPP